MDPYLALQPIEIQGQNGFLNRLNAYMGHLWDDATETSGGQLPRFPTQIVNDGHYIITYMGAPPRQQRFRLNTPIEGDGIWVRVVYHA